MLEIKINKMTTLLLLIALNQNALALGSSAHSSAHASVHPAIIASSVAASNSARMARERQRQAQFNMSQVIPEAEIKGVIRCLAAVESKGSADIAYACYLDNSWSGKAKVSISRYFELFRPSEDNKIFQVIYDESNEKFIIYYT